MSKSRSVRLPYQLSTKQPCKAPLEAARLGPGRDPKHPHRIAPEHLSSMVSSGVVSPALGPTLLKGRLDSTRSGVADRGFLRILPKVPHYFLKNYHKNSDMLLQGPHLEFYDKEHRKSRLIVYHRVEVRKISIQGRAISS